MLPIHGEKAKRHHRSRLAVPGRVFLLVKRVPMAIFCR